jgi:uncharacterized protein (TIGR02594 family)
LAYFAAVGHPECKSDEIAWCAARMGAALKAAGYPIPPVNVNLMARSYLTYGTHCQPKVGAIVIFPRGNNTWQGHVACVVEVKGDRIKYVAGNQSDMVTYGTADINRALDYRWPVEPTVAALRVAGSTEVKKADTLQNAGTVAVAAPAAMTAVETILGPIKAPVSDGPVAVLSYWKSLVKAFEEAGHFLMERPWLLGLLVLGFSAWWLGRAVKNHRLAKHLAGAPLSGQVSALDPVTLPDGEAG